MRLSEYFLCMDTHKMAHKVYALSIVAEQNILDNFFFTHP